MNELDFAVLIGIEHYKGIGPLGGPHEDTKKFFDWLVDLNGGALPVNLDGESDNILKLLSTPAYTPTKEEIDDWMNDMMDKLQLAGKKARRLYFYFSGHGIGVTQMNSAMLLPKWTFSNRNYALSSEKYLLELANKGTFAEIFFFMDCCRNRISGVQGSPPTWAAPSPGTANSEYIIQYASEFDKPSYEVSLARVDGQLDNDLPRGLFTEVLLNGLRGAAADTDGTLKVTDLIRYVTRRLPKLAIAHGKTQIPRVTTEIDLDKQVAGPFPRTFEVSFTFQTLGIDVILEDMRLIVLKEGNTSDGQWEIELGRGEYVLRRRNETDGQIISIDGTQTQFSYA